MNAVQVMGKVLTGHLTHYTPTVFAGFSHRGELPAGGFCL
jgi:hypothetical protein